MSKSLDTNIVTEINAQSKRPRLLAELKDAKGQVVLRYAASESNITFPNGGNTWTAKFFRITNVGQKHDGQIDRVTVEFDNVARDIAALVYSYTFEGGKLRLLRIYLDSDGNAPSDEDEYNEVFDGTMEVPKGMTMIFVPITATVGNPLIKRTLKLNYTRNCDHIFGDEKCNIDGIADLEKVRGAADSGSSTTLVDSDLIQKDDYWNGGNILIIKGTSAYVASVTDFADGTVTFADIGTDVDNSCIYTMHKSSGSTLMTMGTADSGNTTTLVDDALTQADDYWKYGIIEIVKDGETYRTNVASFDADTDTIIFDVNLPISVDNTCKYFLKKGCDKTWDTCLSDNVYGPESDNSANFLGFIHIGIPTWGGKPGTFMGDYGPETPYPGVQY